MNTFQVLIVVVWGIYAACAVVMGFKNVITKNNPYGLSKFFSPLGSFVWADAVIFGVFFLLASLVSIILNDFVLFLLIFSLFWSIRSVGEQMYWFMEQFATQHRNPEHTLWFSKYFKRNSSWIAMQIYWQCISVIAIISTVYLFVKWLK